jgi:hypothetical protein
MFALPDHGDLAGNNIPNATRTIGGGLVTLKGAATRRRLRCKFTPTPIFTATVNIAVRVHFA